MEPRQAQFKFKNCEQVQIGYIHMFYADADGEPSFIFEHRNGELKAYAFWQVESLKFEKYTGSRKVKR